MLDTFNLYNDVSPLRRKLSVLYNFKQFVYVEDANYYLKNKRSALVWYIVASLSDTTEKLNPSDT